jgi:hypothetical protein
VEALEGQNPGEHPAVDVLITRLAARDSWKGKNPGTAACRAGLCLRRRYTDRGNGMWVLPPGNGLDTFRKEKAPKGESQERCRCETKPARNHREEAAKRVAKP